MPALDLLQQVSQILKGGLHDAGQLTVVTGGDAFRLTSTMSELKKSGHNYVEA
ncbi:hypothetical protein [Metasolibacillus meyeri]|uniref:hypothetical protein n=1 Tax=Metasolibacillus meyeri TaxID=1071052 RepID=UPI00187D66A2|nr:hypothetical protein [Metasolibacillus meyeri]